MRLILPDRTDFTTFRDFQKYCSISNEEYAKLVGSDPDLQNLLIDSHLGRNLEIDPMETLQSFLYYIIYLLEDKTDKPDDKELSFEFSQSVGPEKDIVFPGSYDDGAIKNAGDALEKRSDVSDPVIVEDGSSSSNGSNSNETEKIESKSQRDVVSVSGSEDWQVEEKMSALEFNG